MVGCIKILRGEGISGMWVASDSGLSVYGKYGMGRTERSKSGLGKRRIS